MEQQLQSVSATIFVCLYISDEMQNAYARKFTFENNNNNESTIDAQQSQQSAGSYGVSCIESCLDA
eukprot:3986062-Ditylum_brightwellii.AAC.2